jgi:hypothetical protein
MEATTKKILGSLGLLGIGIILFSSFKKKPLKGSASVYDFQSNAPTGTTQVFSKKGTQIYDNNFNVIYTYDTACLGMTITGTKGVAMYSVVIGQDFSNGIAGFVFKNEVENI